MWKAEIANINHSNLIKTVWALNQITLRKSEKGNGSKNE